MTAGEPLSICISDVCVEVRVDHPEPRRGLVAVWGAAGAVMPTTRWISAGLAVRSEGATVWLGDIERDTPLEDALPAFEALLYDALPSWHPPPRVLIHSAAVAWGDEVLLMVGPSGAGKSTLSSALVRSGAEYLTDELVVFDGTRLWGIPRAPQFEPVAEGASLPPWLAATDRDAYRYVSASGERVALPLCPLEPHRVARRTFDPQGVRVVFPKMGAESRVRPLSPVAALNALVGECRSPLRVDLGGLTGSAAEVIWNGDSDVAALLGAR